MSVRIAVASGKGGTGKTTLAVNLAAVWEGPLALVDCDVEEPNCHLFLQREWTERRRVSVLVPEIDSERCDGCRRCADVCLFNAIVVLGGQALVSTELCHSCGACSYLCPRGAIREVPREIGWLETADGPAEDPALTLIQGRLDVGEPVGIPLVEAARRAGETHDLCLIDAPPGTSCPVVASTRGVDYLLLVTEPTPFGLNDLELAVEMARQLSLPFGVAVNRADLGDDQVARFCETNRIPILTEIPFDRAVAECYSRGELPGLTLPGYRRVFADLWTRIFKEVGR